MTAPAEPAVVIPAAPPSPLKALGWAVCFLLTGILLTTGFALLGSRLGNINLGAITPASMMVQSISGLAAFGLMTWAIGLRVLRLTLADLRWKPFELALPGFGGGFLLGAFPAALAIMLSLVLGSAEFLVDEGTASSYLTRVLGTTLLLAPAALFEEVMFRGVGQVVLARALGRVRAVLLLSALFSLAHFLNPNGTLLGMFNIALAGVFLGFAFYLPGGIWTAWGAHLGWNATLAALDAPVSGVPLEIPLIDYAPGSPQWLTGGSFGPEGGLLATATIAVGIAVAARWMRKETA